MPVHHFTGIDFIVEKHPSFNTRDFEQAYYFYSFRPA